MQHHPPSKDRLTRFLDNPRKALWRIAAPMMAGFTVHALYSIVDSIFIGKLGAEALAASGYIGAIFFAAIALTNGLSTGITACVARAYGARQQERMNQLASNGLLLSMTVGTVFTALGLLVGPRLISLLGASGTTAAFAWEYMFPLWLGMPLFFFSTALRSVINGEGDARTPMIILAMSTTLNLLLDPIFIFVLDLGIAGASYATILAHGFALLVLIYVVFAKKRLSTRYSIKSMAPSRELLSAIIGIGLPATMGQLVMAAGMIVVNKILSSFGQIAVAGYVAGNRVDMVVALPLLGIASATMTLVGMYSGANRSDLVRFTTLYAYRWGVAVSILLGGTIYLFADHVVGLFVADGDAIQIGRQYLGYAVFAYPLMAVGMTTGRILQGLGFGWPSLIITSVRVLLFGALGAYVAVFMFDAGIHSVWMSFIAGGIGALFLSAYWIRKHLWKGNM
ncbi:MAG: MATE family efflux transporter [Deltaproteobacteria bacterium]|nr:MATE family efflux transporter [Deltaproteobacteria bacterium]